MLSQTIDEIMSRAKKFEHTTRATKFSSVFKTAPQMPKEEYKMRKWANSQETHEMVEKER